MRVFEYTKVCAGHNNEVQEYSLARKIDNVSSKSLASNKLWWPNNLIWWLPSLFLSSACFIQANHAVLFHTFRLPLATFFLNVFSMSVAARKASKGFFRLNTNNGIQRHIQGPWMQASSTSPQCVAANFVKRCIFLRIIDLFYWFKRSFRRTITLYTPTTGTRVHLSDWPFQYCTENISKCDAP